MYKSLNTMLDRKCSKKNFNLIILLLFNGIKVLGLRFIHSIFVSMENTHSRMQTEKYLKIISYS